jgi:hypothetical protein
VTETTDTGLETTAGEAQALTPESQALEVDRSDYEQRLASEPGFAQAEAKKHQARADRIENEYKGKLSKLQGLEPWVDSLGGTDAVLQHLGRLGAMQGNQQMRTVMETWERTGVVPGGGATDSQQDDVYLDPAERKVKELETQLNGLREEVSRTRSAQSQGALKGDLDRFFAERNYLDDEDKAEIISRIDTQVRQWDQTPAGREVIGKLNYDSIKFLASPIIAEKIEKLGERVVLQKQQQKQRATTSVGSPVQPNGREVSTTAKSVGDALKQFLRQNNLPDTEFSPDLRR